ncbi:MAG: hypothetical protein K5898_10700 [Ruminococcus sp.]|uniref:hypothetical protein n=1 Tax=Ruminococcus sp. TaxID=41978 RepID=UPI0025E1755D|nr:hypothetical protein [Ruminococcus sp.]MCR4795609.1 hypothetical protein [Ruminococcus sp.]
MNSISKRQLAALLLITDMFELFCFGGSMSLETLYGVLAGIALQLLAALVFAAKGGELKKQAAVFYLVYAVFCGGTLFSALWRTSGAVYIPSESGKGIWGQLLTAGLIALVCLYSSSTGIKPVARAAVIAAAAGIFCLGIDFASAVLNADWSNITVPERKGFFYEVVRGGALSGGLGSMVVLSGEVREGRQKAFVWYFAAKAAVSAVLILTVLAVTGGIMEITDFPVITAAQLSQPFDAQRIDSLFLVIFAVFAVFSAALQVMTGAYLIKRIFPQFVRWRSSTVIAVTIGAALLISGRELLFLRAAAAAAALIIAPLSTKRSAAKSSG